MRRSSLIRAAARILVTAILAFSGGSSVFAADDIAAFNEQVKQLARQGKFQEAATIAEKTLALAERTLGAEQSETLQSVANLARLYSELGRFGEAEILYSRALTARERVLGAEHPDTLSTISDLADLYEMRARYREAETLVRRVLAAAERTLGAEHPETIRSVTALARLHQAQGHYGEAEPLYHRALAAAERTFGVDYPSTLGIVQTLAGLYQAQGRYREAEPLRLRILATTERTLGPEHPYTLQSVTGLAALYGAQGRYNEAQPLFRRAMMGAERIFGAEHPNTLSSVADLATLYYTQGRHTEAEPLFLRALSGTERVFGAEHPETLRNVDSVGMLYQAQGRYSEAEPLYLRALAGAEHALGPQHPATLRSVAALAGLLSIQGRYSEAEPLYIRALTGAEQALGSEHPQTLQNLSGLATLYLAQGRFNEAEPLFRRALVSSERVLGVEHPDTLRSVNDLAGLLSAQGRYAEAEPLHIRTLASTERLLGAEHSDTLLNVGRLADLYLAQGRLGEAEPLYRRVLTSQERVYGAEHPNTLGSVAGLAVLYDAQERYGEAEPLHLRAVAGAERALGAEHPTTLRNIRDLARMYGIQGRLSEAEPLLLRALAGAERVLGPEHPQTLLTVNDLAALSFDQGDWTRAAALWRRSTTAVVRRTQQGALGQVMTGKKKSDAELLSWQFQYLVRTIYRLMPEGRAPDAAASREMFQTAQWALNSEAAQSFAQMAVRVARSDGALAMIVRERQDLLAEWQKREVLRNTAVSQEISKRNGKAEAENITRMRAIDARLAEIDTRLSREFPDYTTLAGPAPLPLDEVQAQLGADEALVLFLDTAGWKTTPEETFIWAVTRTDARWVRSELGTTTLAREMQALRCGLDDDLWATAIYAAQCTDLLGLATQPGPSMPLPFDLARAYSLYKGLFGQVEDLIKGKHLLLVPSGPLTQLPFQALITAPPPAPNDYASAAWLVRKHAITILPAVSSLKALRRTARPSAATKPFIGFGNPLLDGPDKRYIKLARFAREKQNCSADPLQQAAAIFGLRNGVSQIKTRGGLADVLSVRELAPLPETADELCAVASDLGAEVGGIHLGARATEHEVKAMSEKGELAKYHIVHFATHGAMAGQLSQGAEPGLILTPPAEASIDDDGYLSGSEIAALKLDADWVILSACNTMAGESATTEALSGLARAFIYAQARALLVSHWAVDSNATVKLITSAMREISQNKTVGRAEALRRAMVTLIDKGDPHEAHPTYWAPFIVVGEGAR